MTYFPVLLEFAFELEFIWSYNVIINARVHGVCACPCLDGRFWLAYECYVYMRVLCVCYRVCLCIYVRLSDDTIIEEILISRFTSGIVPLLYNSCKMKWI